MNTSLVIAVSDLAIVEVLRKILPRVVLTMKVAANLWILLFMSNTTHLRCILGKRILLMQLIVWRWSEHLSIWLDLTHHWIYCNWMEISSCSSMINRKLLIHSLINLLLMIQVVALIWSIVINLILHIESLLIHLLWTKCLSHMLQVQLRILVFNFLLSLKHLNLLSNMSSRVSRYLSLTTNHDFIICCS